MEQVGTVRAAAWIYLLGGVVSCASCGWRRSVLEDLRLLGAKYLLVCGGLFSAYMICLYMAVGLSVDRSQVVEVGLINYLWPALTLILAVPLLHRRVRFPRLVLGMSLAILGTYLATVEPRHGFSSLASNSWHRVTPYLLALLAAILWAFYSNLSRLWGENDKGSAVPIFILATGVILLCLVPVFGNDGSWTWRALWNLLYMAIVPTFLAYVSWDLAIRRGDFVLLATFAYLTPLLATLISAVYLGVRPGPRLWIACLLVVAGAWVCNWAFKQKLCS
jgi:drug/metabolite transporter (DMT)-like permease